MKGFLLALPVLSVLAAAPPPLSDSRAEPALPTGRDIQDRPYPMLAYVRVSGGPFTAPLRWDRIAQGELGTCFFLSTLAAIAHDRPLAVSGAIRGDGHGAFVVTLHGADGRAREIAVDDRFPTTGSGKTFFGRGLDSREIRPALFEKAYAKLLGGYSAIDGGDASAAFLALTGVVGADHAVAGLTEEQVWTLLTSARAENRPIVASTLEFPELKRLTGRADLGGVIDDHVYAVIGLVAGAGGRFVRLYTPLSPGDAGYAKDGPRLLELPLKAFKTDFDTITVGR
ncbi:MAG: hypothetical protein KGJ84_17890 [Elusimicrobia bacterium]|nr:hypothetical protein [Elusimicrobiota bacterium]